MALPRLAHATNRRFSSTLGTSPSKGPSPSAAPPPFSDVLAYDALLSLYLEDLFVQPAHRGKGAGIALMKALAKEAIANECRRFVWQVLDWNEPAITFYERLGANVLREWLTVRLEGDALVELAG